MPEDAKTVEQQLSEVTERLTQKEAAYSELQGKFSVATKTLSELMGKHTSMSEAHGKIVGKLAEQHSTALFADPVYPDVLQLAPKIEIDPETLEPKAESLDLARKWREEHKDLFRAAISTPAIPGGASTPAIDPGAGAWTAEKWDELAAKSPAEFARLRPQYLAWCRQQDLAKARQ